MFPAAKFTSNFAALPLAKIPTEFKLQEPKGEKNCTRTWKGMILEFTTFFRLLYFMEDTVLGLVSFLSHVRTGSGSVFIVTTNSDPDPITDLSILLLRVS